MPKFYFTYGIGGNPFYGGWTVIEAPTRPIACTIFKMIHPCKSSSLLNCASVYDEDNFQQTSMYKVGNFGYRCHERLTLRHAIFTKKGVTAHDQESK